MTALKGFCGLAALAMVGGCATVALGGGGAEQVRIEADDTGLVEAQYELRQAVGELETTARSAGWWAPDNMGGAVQRALSMLMHGRGEDEDDPPAPDRVGEYIATKSAQNGEAAIAALASDVEMAESGARRINTAASLVLTDAKVDPATLSEDVTAVEHSIGVVRRARALFAEALARLDTRTDRRASPALASQLTMLDAEIDRMSALADALAARRSDQFLPSGGAAVG